MNPVQQYHVIPVGDEIIHDANENCSCRPYESDDGAIIHHAIDGREQRERCGGTTDEGWVLIGEVIGNDKMSLSAPDDICYRCGNTLDGYFHIIQERFGIRHKKCPPND
jgi:hypothetical protein